MNKFSDSLDLSLQKAFEVIEDGVSNSKSYFHHPTLNTFDENFIASRTVVLRGFDKNKRVLRFHSDKRSKKIDQIVKNSISTVHAYDHEQKIQIKLKGASEIHHMDNYSKEAWDQSRPMSKECYSVSDAPGREISDPSDYDLDKNSLDVEKGYENFVVIFFHFSTLEFLYLQRSGHRRSLFNWSADKISKTWLNP